VGQGRVAVRRANGRYMLVGVRPPIRYPTAHRLLCSVYFGAALARRLGVAVEVSALCLPDSPPSLVWHLRLRTLTEEHKAEIAEAASEVWGGSVGEWQVAVYE
jgi:hypothetical protein